MWTQTRPHAQKTFSLQAVFRILWDFYSFSAKKRRGMIFESRENASICLLNSSVACLRRPLWTQTRPHAQNTFPCKRFFAFCEFLFWKERTYLKHRLVGKLSFSFECLSFVLIASLLRPQRTRNRPCTKNVFLTCGLRHFAQIKAFIYLFIY